MRIADTQRVANLGRRKSVAGSGASEVFADHLRTSAGSEAAADIGPVGNLASLGGLLAIQDEGFDRPKPQSEFDRGAMTLDRLEDLRLQLLEGNPDRALLEDIEQLSRDRVEQEVDPKLEAILDDIELRAAVELAKLERA